VILSDDQRRAVERIGQDVCVVAGPGSGKTRVLTERFAWLVENQGVDPSRILAVTFTEKAANEIKQRLVTRFGRRSGVGEGIERAWVSTIHGFCARFLREHAIAAGLAPDFTVLEQGAADRMAREAAEEALDELFEERAGEMRGLLESLDLSTQDDGPQPDLARSLLDVYEAMRLSGLRELPSREASGFALAEVRGLAHEILADATRGNTANQVSGHSELRSWARAFLELGDAVDFELAQLNVNRSRLVRGCAANLAAEKLKGGVLERLEAEWLSEQNAPLAELLREGMRRLDARYREKKRKQSALDFADLEEETIRVLESEESIRRETAQRFDEILLDELQDTNGLQWRLANLIRRRLFAVGDINQSIYGFRYAEPAVFREYRAGLVESGFEIDELRENHRTREEILDAVAEMLDGQAGIEAREVIAARGVGGSVERFAASGENTEAAEDAEAGMVAGRIRELVDSGEREYRDIAVLVRAMRAAEPFGQAFDLAGIPFLVSGGRTFLEAREVLDVTAFIAALVNPMDEVALIGVLRGPLVGMGDEEIYRIGHEGWLETFERLFGDLRRRFEAPDLLVARALDECGYAGTLRERERANVEKLIGWLRREHASRPRPLKEMLGDLEALRAQQSEAEAPPPDALNVVRVMSIHAAKGLEFPVVFVGALHRKPDARRPVIAFSKAAGLGAKWRHPVTGRQSDAAHLRVIEELKKKEREEESRLLYVAMTRAEDRLILSHAETKHARYFWRERAEAVVPAASSVAVTGAFTGSGAEPGRADVLYHAPSWTGQYDSSAAVTSIAMFGACPRKYFLSTIARGESRGEGEGGMALGLAAHRILAGEAMEAREAEALVRGFRESELGRRAERASRVEREFDFLLHVEDVVLRGQIDFWFEEAGELVLVDYKTDREESPEQYALQLRLYALALGVYAGRIPDRAVLYYLRSNREVEIDLSEGELKKARDGVGEFRAAQEAMEFPLRVGERCGRCEFFGNACPAAL
jgi:ATP-dependent helicase/nuclease subunit A